MGLDFIVPDGAMYLFARINQEGFDGVDFANSALEKGLAVAPGEGFGNYKNFIFKMKLPPGFNVTIPALGYSGNFTYAYNNKSYDIGVKTNASVTRNMNITVNCGDQSLTFVGADVLKPKSIDMENAFICDQANNALGMNSSSKSWNKLVGDIGMGGKSDHIELDIDESYSSSNTIKWCNDQLENCTTVTDLANCRDGGNSNTKCGIPTSLGFSTYQITAVAGGSDDSGSGGGGGGGGVTVTTNKTNASSLETPTDITTLPTEGDDVGSGTKAEAGDDSSLKTLETQSGEGITKKGAWKFVFLIVGILLVIGIVVVAIVMASSAGKKK